jgi:hypothetical protein
MQTTIQKILSGQQVLMPLVLLLIMAGAVSGAPPHPDLILRAAAGEARLPYYLTHYEELKAKGVNSPAIRHRPVAKSGHVGHAMAPTLRTTRRASMASSLTVSYSELSGGRSASIIVKFRTIKCS